MKIFPSLRRFARSIEEKGRTSRNGVVLALRLHFWSRVGQFATFNGWNSRLESCHLERDDKWVGPYRWRESAQHPSTRARSCCWSAARSSGVSGSPQRSGPAHPRPRIWFTLVYRSSRIKTRNNRWPVFVQRYALETSDFYLLLPLRRRSSCRIQWWLSACFWSASGDYSSICGIAIRCPAAKNPLPSGSIATMRLDLTNARRLPLVFPGLWMMDRTGAHGERRVLS